MWFWKQLVFIVFVAVGTLAVASPGTADHHAKSGTFEFILAANNDYTVVEQAGQTITAGSLKGSITLITSSGGPFKEGSSQTVLGVIYAKKSDKGLDLIADATYIDSDGDKIFINAKRTAGDISVGGGGNATQKIIGGTGKYEGVQGVCGLLVEYLPDNRTVVRGSCEWELH